MKRDMDLIRTILLQAESTFVPGRRVPSRTQVQGFDDATVAEHLVLMEEAGLIEASIVRNESRGATKGRVTRITSRGHDFLDLAREENRWRSAVGTVASKGGALTIEVLSAVLSRLATSAMGLPG